MSKGNPIVQLRIDPELVDAIDKAIESRNAVTRDAPWTRSDWLRGAVIDKLKHIERSRSKGRAKGKAKKQGQGGAKS